MPVEVDGRKVYLRKGDRSQSINVCDANNRRGVYEHRVYLFPPYFVTESQVVERTSVDDLVQWLLGERYGQIEEQAPQEEIEEDATIGSDATEDDWLRQAIFLVEQSIDQLLREFLTNPYSQRVEHSIHARLFTILTSHTHFQQPCPFHGGHFLTQPVHKEWPETKRRPETRRGNFDLAVLPPGALSSASPDSFRKGLIVAPIAIEIGLDYGVGHLADDQDKLLHSRVPHGYLLHLTRVGADDPRVTEIVEDPGSGSIKAGFARITPSNRFVKFVGDARIQEWKGF
jgi:hypothetical protein